MDRTPLQLAMRETQTVFTSPRALVIMAAAILVLGLSGPFDTYSSFNTAERLVYWGAVVLLTYGVGQAVAMYLLAALAPSLAVLPARIGLAALICSVPVTLIVIAINRVAFGVWTGSIDPLQLWAYCLAISLAVVTVISLFGFGQQAAPAPGAVAPPPPPAPGSPLLERIPHPLRGRLVALTVEDHYVEVITEKGKALVLMRLADAMRETGATEGLQIHRSHWVAKAAVVRLLRADGKVLVELSNGLRLPVSRSYQPAVRALGLG